MQQLALAGHLAMDFTEHELRLLYVEGFITENERQLIKKAVNVDLATPRSPMPEMTDEFLSLEIALLIEPKPTHDPLEIEYAKPQPKPIAWKWNPYPTTVFAASITVKTEKEWHPRDFVSDPAAILMLMERLAGDGGFSLAGSNMGFSCCSLRMGETSGCQQAIGRAVAEAFHKSQSGVLRGE